MPFFASLGRKRRAGAMNGSEFQDSNLGKAWDWFELLVFLRHTDDKIVVGPNKIRFIAADGDVCMTLEVK